LHPIINTSKDLINKLIVERNFFGFLKNKLTNLGGHILTNSSQIFPKVRMADFLISGSLFLEFTVRAGIRSCHLFNGNSIAQRMAIN